MPLDYPLALSWFQKAIDAGSADAMSNLAILYLRGIGLPRDPANAFRWFVRAAASGNVRSMHTAGVMAEEGLGTSADPALAQVLYIRAAQCGYAPAMLKVSDYVARRGAPSDLVEAYAWLQLASQSEVPDALQIEILAKLDRLEARLGPDERDLARVRAVELAAIVKRMPPAAAAARDVDYIRAARTVAYATPATASSASIADD